MFVEVILSVANEVKKLKDSGKNKGNKVQYEFNSDLSDTSQQVSWPISHHKLEYANELLTEVGEKVKTRNKLIRIADTSEGG
jgi:hypothetical protein